MGHPRKFRESRRKAGEIFIAEKEFFFRGIGRRRFRTRSTEETVESWASVSY